jgi:hypothetical protein
MPKKIKFESFKFRFLAEAKLAKNLISNHDISWIDFLNKLEFEYRKKEVAVIWKLPNQSEISFDLNLPNFYLRGDIKNSKKKVHADSHDQVKKDNEKFFSNAVNLVAEEAMFFNKKQL